jgi:hypothetical protein
MKEKQSDVKMESKEKMEREKDEDRWKVEKI